MKVKVIPPTREDNSRFLVSYETIDISITNIEIVSYTSNFPISKLTEKQRKYILDKAARQAMVQITELECFKRKVEAALKEIEE